MEDEKYNKILNLLDAIVANTATKDDIANMVTRDDIATLATKDDLKKLEERVASKQDVSALSGKIDGIWRHLDAELDKRKALEVRVTRLEETKIP